MLCAHPQNALSGTPTKFDGGYYAEVIAVNGLKGQFGWFASDMHGFCNTFKAKSGTASPNVVGRKLKQVRLRLFAPGFHPPPSVSETGPSLLCSYRGALNAYL